jgi:hypothetical protein
MRRRIAQGGAGDDGAFARGDAELIIARTHPSLKRWPAAMTPMRDRPAMR